MLKKKSANDIKIKIRDLCFQYGGHKILDHITEDFYKNEITAIIGPSGNGKSTFLKTLNRLWEETRHSSLQGQVEIRFQGKPVNIYSNAISLTQLRRSVGMIFQTPNPLPMSIYKNVAFPLKLAGVKDKNYIGAKVEAVLKKAFLWNEVKDRLKQNALNLSGGQQQRLCIARALILEPEILLLDEPTSSLDQTASGIIEELILSLKKSCTLIMVSHDQKQVERIADRILELSDQTFKELSIKQDNSDGLFSNHNFQYHTSFSKQ